MYPWCVRPDEHPIDCVRGARTQQSCHPLRFHRTDPASPGYLHLFVMTQRRYLKAIGNGNLQYRLPFISSDRDAVDG
jgi:hypothetical protein